MDVQVRDIEAGDRVWHNGSTEMVAAVRYSMFSGTYTVTWNSGGWVMVRDDHSWSLVA